MKHPVFGVIVKKYSEGNVDVWRSNEGIWVAMIGKHVIGFTWKGYNGYKDVKENISKIIQYYANPQSAVWI